MCNHILLQIQLSLRKLKTKPTELFDIWTYIFLIIIRLIKDIIKWNEKRENKWNINIKINCLFNLFNTFL